MHNSKLTVEELTQTCKMYGACTVDDSGNSLKRKSSLKKNLADRFNVHWVRIAAHSCTLQHSPVAKVFTRLLGLEQRQGAGEMEKLGKLICREEVRIKNSIKHVVVTTRNTISTLKGRCKEGCEAALAAQVEARKARSEADQLEILEKRCTSLGQGAVLQPAAIVQHRVQLQHGAEPCESTRSATGTRDAAASLASLSRQPLRTEWSCTHCSELLEEKLEACRARDAALESARTATQLRMQAECAEAGACTEAERRCSELTEAHELEVGRLQGALATARRARSAAGKDARQEAERQRLAAARARGHQETAVINHASTFRELEQAQAALAKAEKRLEQEKEARRAVEDKHETWHARQLEANQSMLARITEGDSRIADLESIERTLKVEVEDLEKQLAGEQVRRGRAEKKAAREPSEEQQPSRSGGRSEEMARQAHLLLLEQHIADRDAKLEEAAVQLAAAAQRQLDLEQQLRQRQQGGQAPQQQASADAEPQLGNVRTFTARTIRRTQSSRGWLEPFTMEFLRRLVDETNMSFSAVPKAVALVWTMLFIEPIPEDFLFSSFTASQAFLRLDHLDKADAIARFKADDPLWAFAADGGNKGTPINVMALSVWHRDEQQPRCEPLACSPLDGDQSARNSADTVIAAIAASGLQPDKCLQGMSDGCETALQEIERVLEEQWRQVLEARRAQRGPPRADADSEDEELGALGQAPRSPEEELGEPPRTSVGESCVIHAKALQEVGFLNAGFPYIIDGLRMMWEIFKGEDHRLEQYRNVWNTELSSVSPALFDSAIAKVQRCAGERGGWWGGSGGGG